MNDFLNSEQKIIFTEKRVIRIYSKHDGQSANFINVETDFINAEK